MEWERDPAAHGRSPAVCPSARPGTLRLVFYDGVNPQPVVDYDGNGGGLTGHILIQAHAEHGDGEAILHAVFTASGESSLLIEPNQEMSRHLTLVTAMQEGVNTSGLF